MDFSHLNSCLIRNQPQVFPTGEEIRQQLCPECVVWIYMDTLAPYFQIHIAESDVHKTTFMLNQRRFFFSKTVMGNRLSSDSWLKASDEVTKGLPGSSSW